MIVDREKKTKKMSKLGQENFGLMKMFLEMRDLRPGWNGLFELSRRRQEPGSE